MAALIREWMPAFRIHLGMSREEMLDLSVPEMVDLWGYYREVTRDG